MKALNQDDDSHGLRMAPLIDIVFLLLIFFLMATTFYEEEKDITIKLAEASQGQERAEKPKLVMVNVRKSGVIVVNQRVKTLDQLEALLRAAKEETPRVIVVVRCDRHALHKHFVGVLNLCEKVEVAGVSVATFQAKE